MRKTVSIVTVSMNAVRFLERTIQSVINQNYSNIEYIIIDGKSTDNTVDLIRKYVDSIDRWVSEKDDGLYDAMNKGIAISSGEWIFFMNAGDVFYSDNTLFEFFSDSNIEDYDIIYGDNYIVDSSFKPVRYLKSGKLNEKTIKKGMPVSHQSVFVKREKCPFYNIEYKLKAEYNWFIDILFNTPKQNILYINKPVIKYPLGGVGHQRYWDNLKEYMKVVKCRFGLVQYIKTIPHCIFIIMNYSVRRIFKINSLQFWNKKNK